MKKVKKSRHQNACAGISVKPHTDIALVGIKLFRRYRRPNWLTRCVKLRHAPTFVILVIRTRLACWIGLIGRDKGHFERARFGIVLVVPFHCHIDLGELISLSQFAVAHPGVCTERNYVQLYTITVPPFIAHFRELSRLHPRLASVFTVPP